MVKKISGNSPIRPGGTGKVGSTGEVKSTGSVQKTQSVEGVQSKSAIQTTGVKSVGSVGATGTRGGSSRIGSSNRPLTPAERQYLMEIVSEEAEKMFADGKISPKKRRIIEDSVKMTLSAGSADGDEEE